MKKFLLFSALICGGCATEPAVVKIPSELLTCSGEPVPGNIQNERELILWIEELRLAGEDCRDALRLIGEYNNADE